MKIELKKIHISERLSEETIAFAADIYVNGIKAGYAKNEGHGGATSYHGYNEDGWKLIKEAEAWCKKQPPIVVEMLKGEDGNPVTLPMNLENYIDNLIDHYQQQKEQKRFQQKMEKDMVHSVLYGVPDSYYNSLKFKMPLAEIIKDPKGIVALKKEIREKVLPVLKEGEKILNTNIPWDILVYAGLSKEQMPQGPEAAIERKKLRKNEQRNPEKSKGRKPK